MLACGGRRAELVLLARQSGSPDGSFCRARIGPGKDPCAKGRSRFGRREGRTAIARGLPECGSGLLLPCGRHECRSDAQGNRGSYFRVWAARRCHRVRWAIRPRAYRRAHGGASQGSPRSQLPRGRADRAAGTSPSFEDARTRRFDRIPGQQDGRSLFGRLSCQQISAGRLCPAIASGTRQPRLAYALGMPGPDRSCRRREPL